MYIPHDGKTRYHRSAFEFTSVLAATLWALLAFTCCIRCYAQEPHPAQHSATASPPGVESVWIEAEAMGPLRGSNFSFQQEAQQTRGSWSLSGPGVAAEWTQGGVGLTRNTVRGVKQVCRVKYVL